jgi:hypothetical protein
MEPSQGEERRKEEKRGGRKRKGGVALFCVGITPV